MAASSSAAANPNKKSFDVFINHRGVDTKKTFAKWLYNGLLSKGLSAFIDNQEMQQGYDISSQIEDAIRTAKVHVAVFSPRYAESDWCLKELVLMLESMAPIIPVFYRVTPSEVRASTTKGKYAESLQTHEKKWRCDSSTIKMWRRALQEVGSKSGFELQACIGNKQLELELMPDLVDAVVKSVLEIVEKVNLHAGMSDLDVAEYPTGLDDKLKDFENKVLLPQQKSGKPSIFGIVGFCGVGKSTLAKEFFNKKKSDHVKSCFLFKVRLTNLESLQSKLLTNLTGSYQQVHNVDEGKGMLKKLLKSCNALVILDDVDDIEQVKALLPVQTHELSSLSLVLITSRYRDVLVSSKVDELSIYRLTELETQHSRELFCCHAFNKTYPLPGFEDLVHKFLKSCNGLPLFLTQFGTRLYKKEISVWEDQLESLPKRIKESLRISYDTLNREEKHIFIDIACIFRGQNMQTAISIWDKTDWKGSLGLQNLLDKSLVEVDSENLIQMRDHLTDLGRDVAASSSLCRLWHTGTKSVIDNLLQQSSEITVRAILMDSEYNGPYEDDSIDIDDSQKPHLQYILRSLQILDTKGSLLEPILRRVDIPNLIWLRWENCPHSSLPSWVPIQNLRVLKVSQSRLLKTLWHREGTSQAPLQLPVCLEEFWADGSVQLKNIRELEQSTKLRVLNVGECSKLQELPSMDTLVSLEELWADGCLQLKSIAGLAQCTKLRQLNVSRCSELVELPSLETLVSLKALWADGCVRLKSIRGRAQCTQLRLLNVRGCSELQELPSMEALVSLEELKADGCVQLKSIKGLQQSTKLQLLWVNGCVQLKSIRGLQQSTKIRELEVGMCSELEDLPRMETLVSLEKFKADGCVQLKSISGLAKCTKLRVLSVNECSELKKLPSMEKLASLEELLAAECVHLKSIPGLAQCTKLQKLDISGCSELEELPSMETLVSLEVLVADGCVRLKSLWGLAQCTKLQMLAVGGCSELKELPSMETLLSLENLFVDECVQLKTIRGLAQCTQLRNLIIIGCSELEDLPSMETLVSLESLCLDGCVQLKIIPGLAQCTKLQRLIVIGCSELVELPSMETLVSLEDLWVMGCEQLKSIQGLAQCTKLRQLIFRGCSALEELPSMQTLVSLEVLLAIECRRLRSIRGLAQCSNLRVRIVPGRSELEEVEGLENMSSDATSIQIGRNIERFRTARGFEIHFNLDIPTINPSDGDH